MGFAPFLQSVTHIVQLEKFKNLSNIYLEGVEYSITGIDMSERALELRKNTVGDLNVAILGDLRDAHFDDRSFDVIYSSYVLEHVDGVRQVMLNFVNWLKPGGLIILRLPNTDSLQTIVSRMTPHKFHVLYKKYVRGMKRAGSPGFGPYPTVYDKAITRSGILQMCYDHGLTLVEECHVHPSPSQARNRLQSLEMKMVRTVHAVTRGRVSEVSNVAYVIRKP